MKFLLIGLAGAALLLWLGFRPAFAAGDGGFFGEAPDAGALPPTQSLEAGDPPRSAAWFAARLGFSEIARSADSAQITIERANLRLVLVKRDAAALPVRDTLRLSLDEASFDAAIAASQAAGDRILWSARDQRRDALLAAHLEGPDMHRIVIVRSRSAAPTVAKRKKAAASAG